MSDWNETNEKERLKKKPSADKKAKIRTVIPRLVDAQKLAREFPKSFEVPESNTLASLRSGDSVKVCNGKERFWVRLIEANGSKLRGVVSNDIRARRYGKGDTIQFRSLNVYDVQISRPPKKYRFVTGLF